MPNSLRVKLSKLRYKGEITQEEYAELIKKLDGHDRQIRAELLKPYDVESIEELVSNSYNKGKADGKKELKICVWSKEHNYESLKDYTKRIRADAINPIQKFIDDYDGAIIISENMGVINGQQLINELKEIVEQLKGAEE